MNNLLATVAFLTLTEDERMELPDNLTLDKIVEAVEADNNVGFCMSCGAEQSNVEPDARNHECETCGEQDVFGAEELLLKLS